MGGDPKARFHETTKIDKVNHRCIQTDCWVKETCSHRPMDNWRRSCRRQDILFHTLLAGEVAFWAKSTVQCSDQLKHKVTLKFNKIIAIQSKVWSLRLRNYSSTGRPYVFLAPNDQNRLLGVQSG